MAVLKIGEIKQVDSEDYNLPEQKPPKEPVPG
jgi:hypothetical protein